VFIEYGQRMGFSDPDYTRRFPLELTVSVPHLANDVDELRTNNLLRASTGYGQGELLTTPLNMAMIVQAILNEGSIPVPYLVEAVRDPQGNVIRERPVRHTERGIMRARTANQVKEIMVNAGDHFYGLPGRVGRDDLVMGGKSGTAQRGGDLPPHSWFIGFVEQGDHSLVIVCMFEEQMGGVLGVPAFVEMARAAAEHFQQE
jgi:cell division protein FtsI/penicillin-binding protein 2